MKSNTTTKILNIVLIIGIVATILIMLGAPFIIGSALKVLELPLDNTAMFYSFLAAFYICAIPYLLALFKLRTLTGLVSNNTPFVRKSVTSLKTISICAFLEIILFILSTNVIKYIFEEFDGVLLTTPIILIGFMCVTLGLLFAVLAKLFKSAIELKEENDMTI